MITNVCLLLEILSILLCVHYLYGEKIKLDIATVSYLAVYMIIMSAINYYDLPHIYTLITYPIMFLYCGVRFGFKIRELIINNILYMIIISGIQFIITWLYYLIFSVQLFVGMDLLVINCISLGVVLFILPICRLRKISIYLQDREKIFFIAILICILLAVSFLINFKNNNIFAGIQSVLLFAIVIVVCLLTSQLGKYKVKAKEIETELKMHKLYADSFQNLIDNIRLRQHEFDNHISTIYNQHYMYHTYGELVNAQKDYCREVTGENRYNKLLTTGNPVIIGFLYGKFVEIEKLGIDVTYKISIDDLKVGVPVYKLIEILGDLMNNAAEALRASEMEKQLFVSMFEEEGGFEVEVRNVSRPISFEEIDRFFVKGYSQKGNNRGLGLYNVKRICNEYKLNVFCENKIIDDVNWLSFMVTNKKETA